MRERGGKFEAGKQRWMHVEMEAKIGVMLPQVKTCLEPLEAGRGKEEFFAIAFGRTISYHNFDFFDSQTPKLREETSIVLSHQVFGHMLRQPYEMNASSTIQISRT